MVNESGPSSPPGSPFSGQASAMPRAVGLALGSGLARGIAHIGVLRTLNKHGVYPGIVAGSSIGALVGGCYLAGKLDELEEWALSLSRKKVFSYLDFRIRSAGLVGGNKLATLLRGHLGDTMIEDLALPYVAIATDLVTGHEVWMRRGDLIDSMRASFALPGVFPPVSREGRFLVDGALVNPVPVSPCQALGARMTIAVDLNADMMGKVAKPGKNYQTVAGFDVFNEHDVPKEDQKIFNSFSLTSRIFRREPEGPSLFGVMVSALNIIQDRLTRSRLAGEPPDVHIKPRIGHIGLLEFERGKELIERGREAAEEALPDIMTAIRVLTPSSARAGADDVPSQK